MTNHSLLKEAGWFSQYCNCAKQCRLGMQLPVGTIDFSYMRNVHADSGSQSPIQ
jgi:hypothetical protein